MLVWHIDVIKIPLGTMDIVLILDEANELTPHRGPHLQVQPLYETLAATIEQAQSANISTTDHTDTTPVEPILGASTTLSSSHSTLSSTLVLLARVQNLGVQMATLLHQIKP